jgi:AraC-like DNA-binding protein
MSYYFNVCLGTGFASWHNDIKIKRALILLADNPDLGILEIAFECGFGSKTAFNNQFKTQTGMTPREYRKSLAVKK